MNSPRCPPVSYNQDTLAAFFNTDAPAPLDQLMVSIPIECEDFLNSEVYTSPQANKSHQAPRRRRKREAIDIPEELAATIKHDVKEVKKIKNRIAAARLRERSQQKIRDLEAEVAQLRERNQLLESRAARCNQCPQCSGNSGSVSAPTSPLRSVASMMCAPTLSPQCQSPSTLDEGAKMAAQPFLAEFETDLLHQLLWQSEELSMY